MAIGVLALYRAPNTRRHAAAQPIARLQPREWALIACAGVAWGVFNAGYVTWLGFAPKMLEAAGTGMIAAASVISVGSWLTTFSGAVCGQVVDRFGHADTVLAICMGGAAAALSVLAVPGAGLFASLLFGLVGMAPAGVIIALSGRVVAPERRAFGMGVFYTIYCAIMTATPPVAGSIFDRTGGAEGPIVFGACLFALVLPAPPLFEKLRATPRSAALREGA